MQWHHIDQITTFSLSDVTHQHKNAKYYYCRFSVTGAGCRDGPISGRAMRWSGEVESKGVPDRIATFSESKGGHHFQLQFFWALSDLQSPDCWIGIVLDRCCCWEAAFAVQVHLVVPILKISHHSRRQKAVDTLWTSKGICEGVGFGWSASGSREASRCCAVRSLITDPCAWSSLWGEFPFSNTRSDVWLGTR